MMPVRILHAVYAFLFALLYVVVSVIYTTSTGRYIYPVLDWNNHPGNSVLFVVMAAGVLFALQFIFYGIYRLKAELARRRQMTVSTCLVENP